MDPLTKDERFKLAPSIRLNRMKDVWIGHSEKFIYIGNEDGLSVAEARALRDWLNKVLP